MPSYILPSTLAVSFIDSLCPICEPLGPRYVTWAPWSSAATSKAQRVRVDDFSNIRAIFLPFIFCCSVPAYLALLWSAERPSRNLISSRLKSSNFRKCLFLRLYAMDFVIYDLQIVNYCFLQKLPFP